MIARLSLWLYRLLYHPEPRHPRWSDPVLGDILQDYKAAMCKRDELGEARAKRRLEQALGYRREARMK